MNTDRTDRPLRWRGRHELNIPNAISALRFPLAALFVLITDPVGRVLIVAVAAASDWIDGRLARARRQVTRVGELIDPVADKTFMLAALITLAADGLLPVWTLPLLLTRDIGVALGALVLAFRGTRVRMAARSAGKLVTWFQFFGIGALLIEPRTAPLVAAVIGGAGLFALADYARAVRNAG